MVGKIKTNVDRVATFGNDNLKKHVYDRFC